MAPTRRAVTGRAQPAAGAAAAAVALPGRRYSYAGNAAGTITATDAERWRFRASHGSHGRHTWHYLSNDPQEQRKWPQTEEDRYWLGLKTVSLLRAHPCAGK